MCLKDENDDCLQPIQLVPHNSSASYTMDLNYKYTPYNPPNVQPYLIGVKNRIVMQTDQVRSLDLYPENFSNDTVSVSIKIPS